MYVILNKSLSTYFVCFVKERKKTFISIAAILVVALISLVWFGGHYMLNGTDLIFPPDRINIFLKTFSIWDHSSLGSVNPRMLAWSFPNGAFLGFSAVVGLSLESAQKLWFYFLFAFSGISMYYLATIITKNENKYAIGVIASLLYMFNPYVALGITNWPYLLLTYASLPLVLGLFIKGLTERKGIKYIIFVNLIWWVTSSSQYVNPKYVILNWLPLFLYLVFHILVSKDRKEILRSVRFTGLLISLWALFNIYWLLPTISYLTQIIIAPGVLYSAIGRSRFADFALNSAPLPDAMRLVGSWLFHSSWMGYPYIYWGKIYATSLFVSIGYLLPVIAFVPLLFKKEKNILFFSIFLLVVILLMSGNQPPFGQITTYFITHIPLAIDVFSLPYPVFGLYAAMGFAVLFGYGLILLSSYIGRKKPLRLLRKSRMLIKPVFVGTIIFLVVGVYAFPIWTGEVAYPGNAILSSSRYKIPDYYYDASNWLSSYPEDFRLYPLPYSIIGYASYAWEPSGYQGLDQTASSLGRSVISGSTDDDLGSVIAKLIVSNSTVEVAKMLALMNVKYIVFHNDVNWEYLDVSAGREVISSYISTSLQNFETILANQGGFTFCKSYGQLDFYVNNYWQPAGVYAASTNILLEGNLTQLIKTAARTDFISNESIITLSNQLSSDQISARADQPKKTLVTYEEINPTQYAVQVDSSQSFYLVLSQSFDNGWVATINGQQIPDQYHFTANGYANGWYINKTGTYTITLEFEPQNLFYAGAAISIIALIVCTAYVSKNTIKNIYKKYLQKVTN